MADATKKGVANARMADLTQPPVLSSWNRDSGKLTLQSNGVVKCSGQFFRNPGSNELEPEFRKIAQMASWVLLKCVFEGLKMAKK